MQRKIILHCLLLSVLVLLVVYCGPSVRTATDAETVTDSGWSVKDLKDVADFMASSISTASFISSSSYVNNKPRWMLAKDLKNDTDEHINTRVIMEKIRTKLINEGTARFIDDQAIDEILKQLEMQQSDLYDSNRAARVGNLVGAQLLLRGRISNIRNRSESTDINYFNITLQVVHMETSDILWTEEKEIQRITEKGTFR